MEDFLLAFLTSPQFAAVTQAVAVLLIYVVVRVVMRSVVRRVLMAAKNNARLSKTAAEGKIKTVSSLLRSAGNIAVFGALLLIILNAAGVDIRPILAGAGIVGFAVGFGMQSLVKDVVSGLFIIVENQFNVGDWVRIGTFEGTVEKISLRSTILKDGDGSKIYIPNGSIAQVVNVRKQS